MEVILSNAVSVITVFFIIDILWPGNDTSSDCIGIKVCLSIGMGPGISSCIFFVCLVLAGSVKKYFIFIDLILLVVCGIIYGFRKKRSIKRSVMIKPEGKDHKEIRYFYVAATVTLLVTILSFIITILNHPHGSWDAWNIYNLGARFIDRGGTEWSTAFSNHYHWTLPDYPLLIQGYVARTWNYSGHETLFSPSLLAFQYTFITILLLMFSTFKFRSKSQGIFAGILLLGMPLYAFQGACLVADVPLSFFILSLIVMFCVMDRMQNTNYNLILLCGLIAGLAAWTKNEGFVLVISVLFARLITVAWYQGIKVYLKETGLFFMGFLPILMIILYFKINVSSSEVLYQKPEMISPLTPIFNQDFKTLINSLADISKYMLIAKTFTVKLYEVGKWMLLVFPIYFFLQGKADTKQLKAGFYTSILILVIMILGYFTVFLIYPLDNIEWLLETTTIRLFIQILPSILFVFFFFIAIPEETASRNTVTHNQNIKDFKKLCLL